MIRNLGSYPEILQHSDRGGGPDFGYARKRNAGRSIASADFESYWLAFLMAEVARKSAFSFSG